MVKITPPQIPINPQNSPSPPQQNFPFLPLQYPPLTVISHFLIPPLTVTLFEKSWTIFKMKLIHFVIKKRFINTSKYVTL